MTGPTPAIARRRIGAAPSFPQLFEVLDCANPLRPPARHSLAGVDEVVFLRAGERSALRDGRKLELGIPDPTMSGTHARLRRQGDQFVIEDLGSTNGTFVDGVQERERTLADYDAIEMGHTELVFRASVPQDGEPDLDAGALDPPAPGLATMVQPLAAELARIPAIARSPVAVVIGGETGTGKELVARGLHQLSRRRGAFVAVNCGGIAPDLLYAELFGNKKGAFTGAVENRPGHVRSADGGTLFLDEIAELPLQSQAALLRVLAENQVTPVGSSEPVNVDVRVVAATHADLEAAVSTGKFRADLLARISGFTIKLPPLRWRREDLGLLIASLVKKHARDGAEKISFTCEAARALLHHRWPMNIRELEKCLESAMVLAGGEPIDVQHLPPSVRRGGADPAFEKAPELRDLVAAAPAAPPPPLSPEDARNRDELIGLLREHHGNVAAVARVMGKARMQIHRWVRRYDLRLADFR
ncbi:MAG: sigma 54-interacting transcriptional regulator [Myxococcales bacterium]|nr:sigma 54-interacting transcriptional regulator [Myxococcales bacterium]